MIRRFPTWCAAAFVPLLFGGAWLSAQTAPREGIQERGPRVHALVGGRLHASPREIREGWTVLIRDGVIEAVAPNLALPPEARVWNLDGHVITAGFIDLDVRIAPPLGEAPESREGLHWNPRIRPEVAVAPGFRIDERTARAHRGEGFTTALVSPPAGILAGDGCLISLGDSDRQSFVSSDPVAFGALESGSWPARSYPGSMMGAIALLRQTLIDAMWYQDAWQHHEAHPEVAERPEYNRSLEALQSLLSGQKRLALRARNPREFLALRRIAAEFTLDPWYVGHGRDYEWLHLWQDSAPALVIPLDYPEAPEVLHPEDAEQVSLRDLELWARAPENPARLAAAGVEFALTPRGLKSVKEFRGAVRKAIENGLDPERALAAVTEVPARLLGLEGRLGRVTPGAAAHLAVFDGAPFEKGTRLVEVWVDGERHPSQLNPRPDLRGAWDLTLELPAEALELRMTLTGSRERPRVRLTRGEEKIGKARLTLDGAEVTLTVASASLGHEGYLRLGGSAAGDSLQGTGQLPDGRRFPFRAARRGEIAEDRDGEEEEDGDEAAEVADSGEPAAKPHHDEPLAVPLGARGRTAPPFAPEVVFVRDATVWTCGPQGVIEKGDVLIEGGRVRAVGENVPVPAGAHVIGGEGLHVTPGLIDPHSHTAIQGGVNEGTQAVTAEVRIGDVIQADDMNIYRQLAGGTTAALLLHGSANPIGGQAALVKWRWGEGPEQLKIDGAHPAIKFALGENVKQANWGERFNTRYPQTRMGVEQIIHDAFLAAKEYRKEWEQARSTPRSRWRRVPRRDLELEALVEILEDRRSIHCHSYRQDEILMLIRLADRLGFRVGTFQHVLEGYKVAPEIARHGAAASSFSDWWAYKFEVYDAIPHNGALLWEAGVLTSFNSDSNELARRLNLEAAKAVKYGGVPPEEALKFMTSNAARQLRLEDRIGSLEVGMDGDFVVWSGSPLSTHTTCLETWIEGRRYFSREEDEKYRERDRLRRSELIARVVRERLGGDEGRGQEPPAEESGGGEADNGRGGRR